MMVGLSVLLEGYTDITTTTTSMTKKKIPFHQIINKSSMIKSPSPTSSFDSLTKSNPFSFSCGGGSSSASSSCRNGGGFLDRCFLCKQKLLPGKDIYMYKGDRAFCSEECRCRQIFMDEEEMFMSKKTTYDHQYCSVAATSAPGSSSSTSSARRKGVNKNQANGFAF